MLHQAAIRELLLLRGLTHTAGTGGIDELAPSAVVEVLVLASASAGEARLAKDVKPGSLRC